MMPTTPTLNRRRFILAATALLLSGCADRQSLLPEFDPTKIGDAEAAKKKERELQKEVKEHKLSEEEAYVKANLAANTDRVRAFCDEDGRGIKDFVEGIYSRQDGEIVVHFFQQPIHETEIGIASLSQMHHRFVNVPLEKAFLVSHEILKEWREGGEAKRIAYDARQLVDTLQEKAQENGVIEHMKAQKHAEDVRAFLGIRPDRIPSTYNKTTNTPK